MTPRERELEQHRRWKLKPQFASLRVFDELLENEFRPPEEQRLWEARAVRSIVRFAAVHTPYYVKLFERLCRVNYQESDDVFPRMKLRPPTP